MFCSSHTPPSAQVGYQFVSTICKWVYRSVEIGKLKSVLVKRGVRLVPGALFWNKEELGGDHVIEKRK